MYTGRPISVVMARERVSAYFQAEGADADMNAYKPGDKVIPYRIVGSWTGAELAEMHYGALLPYVRRMRSLSRNSR